MKKGSVRPYRLFGYRDAGHLFLWGFAGLQLVGVLMGLFCMGQPELLNDVMLSSVCSNAALTAVYAIYTRAAGVAPVRAARIAGFKWWVAPIGCVLTFALQYMIGGSMGLFSLALESSGYESVNPLVGFDFLDKGAFGLVGYLLLVGMTTGFCEELLFRGGLLQALRGRMNDTAAVCASAALFSLFHCSPDQTIFQFFFGALLAYVTVRAGSVIPAMIMHAFNNILSVATAAAHVEYLFLPTELGALIAAAIVGLLAAVTLVPLAVDAMTGRFGDNAWVKWIHRIRRRDGNGAQVTETVGAAAAETDGKAIAAEANASRISTVMLAVGAALCVGLWIMQLVSGYAPAT